MAEPKVVAPDTATLRTIAGIFTKEAQTLDGLKVKLDLAWVTPGSSVVAKHLQTRFNDRKTTYLTFLTDLKFGSEELGRQLVKVANRYDTTEDINKDDAKRLTELIDALKTRFPGIEGVVTTEV